MWQGNDRLLRHAVLRRKIKLFVFFLWYYSNFIYLVGSYIHPDSFLSIIYIYVLINTQFEQSINIMDGLIAQNYSNWVFVAPTPLFTSKLDITNQLIVPYSQHDPSKASEIILCTSVRTGVKNQDRTFCIEIANNGGHTCKHYLFGHGYGQEAWKYNSDQFGFPASEQRELRLSAVDGPTGNSELTVQFVAYR